jgi:hypothetical protein
MQERLLQEIPRFTPGRNQIQTRVIPNLRNTIQPEVVRVHRRIRRRHIPNLPVRITEVILLHQGQLNRIRPLQIQEIAGRIPRQADHREAIPILPLHDRAAVAVVRDHLPREVAAAGQVQAVQVAGVKQYL